MFTLRPSWRTLSRFEAIRSFEGGRAPVSSTNGCTGRGGQSSSLLVCAALGTAVWWWQGRPERHLARAEEAVRDGDRDEALVWLAVPEVAPPTRERALLLRARIAVEQGKLAAAVRSLDQVDPKGPSAANYAFWRGRTLYAAGEPLLAITWFTAALKRRPDDADTYRWLAAAAYDQGNRQTAVASLEAVTRLQPEDSRAWRTLGLIFKEDVEYEQARAAFERALAIDGAQPAVRFDLAEVLLKLGDVAGVEREMAACRGRGRGGPARRDPGGMLPAAERSCRVPRRGRLRPGGRARAPRPASSSGRRSTWPTDTPTRPSSVSTVPSRPTLTGRRRSTSAVSSCGSSGGTRRPGAT